VPQQSFAGFIDWTSFSNPSGTTSVSGLLSGSAVTATISGTGGSARIYAPGSSINNTYSWTGSAHIPNLVNSDMLYFENLVANSVDTWTVSFSAPVENPVFLFKGLERTYSFDSGITLLSANTPGYIVSGNSITGNTFTPSNAGSLQLFGTYTSLMIVGTGITGGDTHNRDAVLVQIGATPYVEPPPPPPPPPEEVNEPSMLTPLMLGLFLIATRLRIRQRQ
tara:strand:- start:5411 stop:6076 length:666 start_codon:yes stop_codon:yes gene_type:complete